MIKARFRVLTPGLGDWEACCLHLVCPGTPSGAGGAPSLLAVLWEHGGDPSAIHFVKALQSAGFLPGVAPGGQRRFWS